MKHSRFFLAILVTLAPGAAMAQGNTSDVPALILQLAERSTEWAAAARLQKLGSPAVVALVANLREDGFRDRYHGRPSPTMRTLEKIGEPAVAEIERALLLSSTGSTPDDIGFTETAINTLSGIGGERAATIQLRLAQSANNETVRRAAYWGLISGAAWADEIWHGRPWEPCLLYESPRACSLDAEAQRIASVVRPLLGSIRQRMTQEPNEGVRLAAAQIMALWGEGEIKAAGEQIINSRYAAGTSTSKRVAVQALFRRGDARYVQPAIDLIKLATGSPPSLGEDGTARRWAIQFSVRSHNIAFVPALIDLLGSTDLNGNSTSTSVGGVRTEIKHTFAEDALPALRMLTFQDFGTDAGRWREWWNANQDSDWRTLLTRHVQGLLPQLASAKPWVMNEWMNGLVEADDPAVLPFVAAYLRHPRLDIYQTSANGSTVGGGTPGVVRLLLNLASQGSREARELIQECSSTTNFPLAIECSRIVVMLGDRQRGLDRLNALLDQHYRWQVAQALVELGDKRGIAAFIGLLASQDVFTRPLAYNTLRHYTQEDIPDDAVAWQQWWRDAQDTFTVKTAAARMDMDL